MGETSSSQTVSTKLERIAQLAKNAPEMVFTTLCKVQTSTPTCGHYLALVVSSQTIAACGFSAGSAYTAINYQ
jgi:hypothetical protein